MSTLALMLKHDPMRPETRRDARLPPAALVSRKKRELILEANRKAVIAELRKAVR